MSGAWAQCPVCTAVVGDAEAHAAWHEQIAAWTAALATVPAPDPVHANRRGWPEHLPVRPVPDRPTPDPVTDTEAP